MDQIITVMVVSSVLILVLAALITQRFPHIWQKIVVMLVGLVAVVAWNNLQFFFTGLPRSTELNEYYYWAEEYPTNVQIIGYQLIPDDGIYLALSDLGDEVQYDVYQNTPPTLYVLPWDAERAADLNEFFSQRQIEICQEGSTSGDYGRAPEAFSDFDSFMENGEFIFEDEFIESELPSKYEETTTTGTTIP